MLEHDTNRSGWVNLSGWCRDQQIDGRTAEINSDVVKASKEWSTPSLMQRAEKLLKWHEACLDFKPNSRDKICLPVWVSAGASYSKIVDEIGRVQRLMLQLDWLAIDDHSTPKIVILSPNGRLHLEQLKSTSKKSSNAFVAMWFAEELQSCWENGFRAGLMNVGYDPVRVDELEHVDRIDDQIMIQIRKSQFIVADFTGHRGGVYFEAGYAMGLGIPIVWTCRSDDVENLHFDIRQYNNIVWENPDDLRLRLEARVENIIGIGPRKE